MAISNAQHAATFPNVERKMNNFDFQFFRVCKQFWKLAKPYWFSQEKWRAWSLLLIIVVSSLISTNLSVISNTQQGSLISALGARDSQRFFQALFTYLAVLLVSIPLNNGHFYLVKKLGLYWRRWMTYSFLDKYLGNRAFYEISYTATIDNPDQRISDDIGTFTRCSLNLVLNLIRNISGIVAFTGVLWSISKPLVFLIVIYAAAGSIITVCFFVKRLVFLNFEQQKKDADFRYGLVRLRENAESVAFYRGQFQELNQLKSLFNEIFKNFNSLIQWQTKYNIFNFIYYDFIYILPSVIVAPLVLSGQAEVGILTQAQGAFSHLFLAVKGIADLFESVSDFGAEITRLESFAKSMETPKTVSFTTAPTIDTIEKDCLAMCHLTLQTPNYQRTLIKELSVTIQPGSGMLIVGSSGCGKSSLLRLLAGLWKAGTGSIVRPKLESMMFLPQRPYMTLGSLRSQLLYPNNSLQISDAELYQVLQQVNLQDLPERFGGFDVEKDWANILSIGEQQRLAFARLLLKSPQYAILDEATSAVDMKNEAILYQHLQSKSITFISVGHRPSLLKYHQQVLELSDDAKWQLIPASSYNFTS